MNVKDLEYIKAGDQLYHRRLGAIFEVVEINLGNTSAPLHVKLVNGPKGLVSGALKIDDFDSFGSQWIFASMEIARDVANAEALVINEDKLVTAEDLDLMGEVSSAPTEVLTASKAVEISKNILINEVMERIQREISTIGVWEITIEDLDLDPVVADLTKLGYSVTFSMQIDAFKVSWLPKI